MINEQAKTVPEAITDLKEELQEFLSTRVAMLRSEMAAKLQTWKMAAPTLVIGLVLLWTAWLAFTGFLICIIAEAFGASSWAIVLSFVIVAVLYGIVGSVVVLFAWKQLKETGVKPTRTMDVLEQDRIWLQTEARTQL